jgi:gas vesicle protein
MRRFQAASMNDRMPYVTPIVSFLAGGIAGATAGFLLASRSGRATRERMARKMGDATDSVRQRKDRVLQTGGVLWGEAAHSVEDTASALSGGDRHELGGKPDTSSSV